MKKTFISALCLTLLFIFQLHGQRGDRRGHKMVENWKEMNIPPAPALSPEEALKTIKVAPGFKLELVASEPDIINPVAMKWDGNGRLWVVQMVDYMPNVDGKGEDAGNGRVSVHEDTNGDGKLDKMTIFLDKLVMPRAISLVEGGVLIAEPPTLWYCKDLDGDFKCDEKIALTKYAKQGPVEHTDNGLIPALDNWIYSAKSDRRFQFKKGKLIENKTKFRGQWGISMDDYGRLYYSSNSVYLFADWETYAQSIELRYGDRSINSIRPNAGINRGYLGNMLGPDFRLKKITAVSEPTIYRGAIYGSEYSNGLFVCEPAANALCYFSYSEKDLSPQFSHQTYPDKKWKKREFITSTDERFRPVSVSTGPDGNIYFLDFNHGILQHKTYVMTYLRKQILERGLDKHNQTGRIYRIVKDNIKSFSKPNMLNESPEEWVQHLSHANGWWRDTAQRLLVQKQDLSVVPALKKHLNGNNHLAKIHALWTLKGLDALDEKSIQLAQKDSHEKVKLTANIIHLDTSAQSLKVASNVKKLSRPDQKLYQLGKKLYQSSCFACHQHHGKGLANLAPPLAGSDWLREQDQKIILLSLHGLTGNIKVSGKEYKNYPVMPGHAKIYDDQKIAAVLTYIKNTWGNKGKAVQAKDVSILRKKYEDRVLPWTEKELNQLK